jgi:diaminohydroxyphosphoribosylaminopyrimidine deaminase/5-amino-6-(5-phosphoribosylamino)uracil reductase
MSGQGSDGRASRRAAGSPDGAADRRFMARALELARRGWYTTRPNPRVGCVLARDGAMVGEGWHERAGGPHAEAHALRAAGDRARGATAYVTLEPCAHHGRTPPCSRALLEAGVGRVVAAMEDPDPRVAGAGLAQLRAGGVEVDCGLMRTQAEALNPGFILRHAVRRPYLRAKLAMTLDGRIATANGESRWITGAEARRDVQRLRAQSCAVMTGIGTVLADDPSLTLRPGELDALEPAPFIDPSTVPPPLRVVVDSRLRTPPSSRLLGLPGPVLLATAVAVEGFAAGDAAEVVRFAGADGRVDLAALAGHLAARRINEVLLEAGPALNGAMLAAGLVDEVIIYMAPRLLGDRGRGLFTLEGVERLDQAVGLAVTDVRAVGADWRVTAKVGKAGA